MYNDPYYEDYIRNVLGYDNYNQKECYECNNYQNNYKENRNINLEKMYPEIYNLIYPMVRNTCKNLAEDITEEKLNFYVDELYTNIEGNDEDYLDTIQNELETRLSESKRKEQLIKNEINPSSREKRMYNGKVVIEEPKRMDKLKETQSINEEKFDRLSNIKEGSRKCCNPVLKDLIKILLLREISEKPNNGGAGRPPFPPPNRPPFPYPGGPGFIPPYGRPPFPSHFRQEYIPYNRDSSEYYEY